MTSIFEEVIFRGQEAAVSAGQAAQGGAGQAAEAVDAKAAARRAQAFAAPLLRVEAGFQAAVLAAHERALVPARATILAGGTPPEAARDAFKVLHPALVRLGKTWFPSALREGWNQGNARLQAAVRGRRKLWGAIYPLPDPESRVLVAPRPSGSCPATPRKGALLCGAAGNTASRALPDLKARRKPVVTPVGSADVQTVFDLDWPEIAEYIAARPVAYAPIAARTTVDMFRAALTAGVEQGLGIDGIVRKILGEQLPGISRYRATLIARTEVLSAGNAANFANYKASGVVTRKVWLSTRDARTRETHRTEKWKRDRVIVPLNDPFVLPSGARLMFPLDDSLGAPLSEICRCRCSIGPDLSMPGIPDFVPGG